MSCLRFLVLCVVLCGVRLFAQENELTDEDRLSLLEQLEQLEQNAAERIASRQAAAYSALQGAVGSDVKANELYLKCVELVRFTEQKRESQSFREWRRRHDEKSDSKGFRRSLRYQISWLLLALEVERAGAVTSEISSSAVGALNKILDDSLLTGGNRELSKGEAVQANLAVLQQDAFQSVFAKAYKIEKPTEDWPGSPLRLDEVYDNLILKPYANLVSIAEYRKGFARRIVHESVLAELKGRKPEVGDRSEKTAAFDIFVEEERPRLLWELEVKVFELGDEVGAARGMFNHLRTFSGHVDELEWTTEMKSLLQGAESS